METKGISGGPRRGCALCGKKCTSNSRVFHASLTCCMEHKGVNLSVLTSDFRFCTKFCIFFVDVLS